MPVWIPNEISRPPKQPTRRAFSSHNNRDAKGMLYEGSFSSGILYTHITAYIFIKEIYSRFETLTGVFSPASETVAKCHNIQFVRLSFSSFIRVCRCVGTCTRINTYRVFFSTVFCTYIVRTIYETIRVYSVDERNVLILYRVFSFMHQVDRVIYIPRSVPKVPLDLKLYGFRENIFAGMVYIHTLTHWYGENPYRVFANVHIYRYAEKIYDEKIQYLRIEYALVGRRLFMTVLTAIIMTEKKKGNIWVWFENEKRSKFNFHRNSTFF